MDGRRWFGKEPEFASVIQMTYVFPAEDDVRELGTRPAVKLLEENLTDSVPYLYHAWAR
jgi:hypothetical protein